MGDKLSVLQPLLTRKSCLHDCFYYVLNDSECHSSCNDACCDCGCETHYVEQERDDSENEISLGDCCLMRQRKGDFVSLGKDECLQ